MHIDWACRRIFVVCFLGKDDGTDLAAQTKLRYLFVPMFVGGIPQQSCKRQESFLSVKKHTFVVCAYGESPYLEDCVKSVVSQTTESDICIATSTPNSLIDSVSRKYQIPLCIRDGESGIAEDWNFAISCAETDLVTVAHQDDVYLSGYSSRLLSVYAKNPDLLLFFTNYGELRNGEPVDSNGLLSVKRAMLFPIRDGRLMRSTFARRRILSFGSAICCPSVAFNLRYLQQPIFESTMKCDLDWQAWEKISRQKGAFYYDSRILMRHRIHEESETTHLIEDNTRGREDLEMLGRFWPSCVARLIYRAYSTSQRSNG